MAIPVLHINVFAYQITKINIYIICVEIPKYVVFAHFIQYTLIMVCSLKLHEAEGVTCTYIVLKMYFCSLCETIQTRQPNTTANLKRWVMANKIYHKNFSKLYIPL